jgi:hypothetical protein
MIKAPWSKEQVEALNHYQRHGKFHPFTCANRSDGNHPFEDEYGDHGALRAYSLGWRCPFCSYTQDWAHEFMFKGTASPLDPPKEP